MGVRSKIIQSRHPLSGSPTTMEKKDFNHLILNRRSIRRYTAQELPAEDVKLILEAGLLAPTSKNSHPWHFIVVDDKEMLQRMSEVRTMGAGPVARCAMAVVVAADTTLSDVWVEDCSIAASYMQLQAAALGLGSCWIQIRNRFGAENISAEEQLQEMLGIPEHVNIECIITLGYKDEQRKPLDPSKTLWEKVHIERWDSTEA